MLYYLHLNRTSLTYVSTKFRVLNLLLIAFQLFIPPGITEEEAIAKPFHIFDDAFYKIIGSNPTLTIIATSEVDPIFHEAVVW